MRRREVGSCCGDQEAERQKGVRGKTQTSRICPIFFSRIPFSKISRIFQISTPGWQPRLQQMSLLWWYSYPTTAWNKVPLLSSAHSLSHLATQTFSLCRNSGTHGLPRGLMTPRPLPLTYHSGLFKLCCLLGQIGGSRQESKWLFNSVFEDLLLPDTIQSSQRSSLSGQLLLSLYQMRMLKCRECWEGWVPAGVQAGYRAIVNLHIILLTTEGTST